MKIALHMCGWGTKPLPDLLIAANKLGYDGVELALSPLEKIYGKEKLEEMLNVHNAKIAPAICVMGNDYSNLNLLNSMLSSAKEHCQWIKNKGGNKLIFFPPVGKEGGYTGQERKNIYRSFEEIADIVISERCIPLYHNHYRLSYAISEEIFKSDMKNLNWKKWKFCPDTAHLISALQDPVEVFDKYKNLIGWVHCKDIKTRVFKDINTIDMSQVGKHLTEIGKGVVDFKRILEILNEIDYDGWLAVEQDRTDKTPYESAKISIENLRKIIAG